MGLPILFRQKRLGLYGEPFNILKFRTMFVSSKNNLSLNDDAQRLTKSGKILRSISLDKSPELWNILKGEMSLVVPRPLLMDYLPLYNSEQARRMEVKPEITGWAQLNGRSAITWEEKFRLDGLLDAQAIRIMWVRYLSGRTPQYDFRPGLMYQAWKRNR